MITCSEPEAFYLARSLLHCEALMMGGIPGCCENEEHRHRILRLYALAHDLKIKDA